MHGADTKISLLRKDLLWEIVDHYTKDLLEGRIQKPERDRVVSYEIRAEEHC